MENESVKSRLINSPVARIILGLSVYFIVFIITQNVTSGKGAFLPTNKAIRTNGITIYHFQDGKICGHTQVFNKAIVRWQLGF